MCTRLLKLLRWEELSEIKNYYYYLQASYLSSVKFKEDTIKLASKLNSTANAERRKAAG